LSRLNRFEADRNVAGLLHEIDSVLEYGPLSIAGQAARRLGRLGETRTLGRVRDLLSSPSANARFDALGAVRDLDPEQALSDALELLSDPAPIVRALAAEAVTALDRTGSVEAVRHVALSDADEEVRYTAAKALAGVDDPRATEIIALNAEVPGARRSRDWASLAARRSDR
jgi:HEAT repeat protein